MKTITLNLLCVNFVTYKKHNEKFVTYSINLVTNKKRNVRVVSYNFVTYKFGLCINFVSYKFSRYKLRNITLPY